MAQLPFEFAYRPALGRTDFLVAPCNQAAIAWLDRWPDWPAPALTLYGPRRSGRTHLGHVWQMRSGARIVDPSLLTTDRIPALLGNARCLFIDNIEQAAEAPLLHLYNLIAERGGHILLVAGDAPVRLGLSLADLRSRLAAAPAIALAPPDEELIGALLVKLFADRQLVVGAEVVAYLALRLDRSFEAVYAAVAALDAAGLAQHRRITVRLARDVLGLDPPA